MRQYRLADSFGGEAIHRPTKRESHYLTRVLRLGPGSRFAGIDRTGTVWDLEIDLIDADGICILRCTKALDNRPETATDTLPAYRGPLPRIFLYQCLCKGRKIEQIVRQATEIGAECITLVQSDFCIADASNKKEKAVTARIERLKGQIKEAIQQSGSSVATDISSKIIHLRDIPMHWNQRGPALFFHQDAQEGQATLSSLCLSSSFDDPIAIVIGAEGGLSKDECSYLRTASFHPVLLKTNILRSETAAIYALSSIQLLMMEKNREKLSK